MRLREATTEDAPLLAELLLAAYNWTGDVRVTAADLRSDPHARRYLEGWRRPGDLGVVAVADGDPTSTDGGTGGYALGAAWARPLQASAPGYGYVADDVPELSMAVRAEHRGLGVGSTLLRGLLDRARDAGYRAVSLSVEDGNAAARALYEHYGFRVVSRTGGSDTMLRVL